jgi:hypothetical protein
LTASASPITFEVRVSQSGLNLTFVWEVLEGGTNQTPLTGSPLLKVNANADSKRIKVRVTITGLPPFCPNVFKGACTIIPAA